MNIKKGLKRIWIVGSVLWFAVGLTMYAGGTSDFGEAFQGITVGIAIWSGLYWGISGFFSDEDKSDENK